MDINARSLLVPSFQQVTLSGVGGVVAIQLPSGVRVELPAHHLQLVQADLVLAEPGGGFWLYYRLLEAGTFEAIPGEGPNVQIDATHGRTSAQRSGQGIPLGQDAGDVSRASPQRIVAGANTAQ